MPIVITGFEPLDLLEGMLHAVRQLEAGRAEVENQYARAVDREGNVAARKLVDEVFEVADRKWRGVGMIPKSGFSCATSFATTTPSGSSRSSDIRHPGTGRSASAARFCRG